MLVTARMISRYWSSEKNCYAAEFYSLSIGEFALVSGAKMSIYRDYTKTRRLYKLLIPKENNDA